MNPADTYVASGEVAPLWPADIIHVNEDGWVLINRGLAQGVVIGQRLLVVGPSVRDLRNLFAPHGEAPAPVALQIRRTYELLEVVYAERDSAVAVAARAPAERRPEFYRGPSGELLVWVPLPKDYTWPPKNSDGNEDDDSAGADDVENDQPSAGSVSGSYVPILGGVRGLAYTPGIGAANQEAADEDDDDNDAPGGYDQSVTDEPPERITQEDHRWEESLPLNGISVGDLVVPALPAAPITGSLASAPPLATAHTTITSPVTPAPLAASPATTEHSADWMKPLV